MGSVAECVRTRTLFACDASFFDLQVWVAVGDIVLVSLREYQDEKGDVILKYTADEARELKAIGEIPEHITISDITVGPATGAEEGGFEFGEESGSESEGGEVDVDAI
jgi:translation initiation factor 1A